VSRDELFQYPGQSATDGNKSIPDKKVLSSSLRELTSRAKTSAIRRSAGFVVSQAGYASINTSREIWE
jgi:precorrin-4 methylase